MFVKCVNPHSASLGPLCADWTIPIYTFSVNAYSVYLPKILSATYQVLYKAHANTLCLLQLCKQCTMPLFLGSVLTIVDIRRHGDHWSDQGPCLGDDDLQVG